MNHKLSQSQKLLRESLNDLYESGGLELFLAGARGIKQDLIIEFQTNDPSQSPSSKVVE